VAIVQTELAKRSFSSRLTIEIARAWRSFRLLRQRPVL